MKARTRHLKCHIYARRWQDYKVCMNHHFMFCRKRNAQVKRLQSGSRTFKRKCEISNDAETTQPQ